ncbi:MAG: LuxR C-terminal-related transcriptional regulator, partial [Proteobacteria bacterium]|nr:LuxR C-terminal-related transcriptional regulator [Pseudomonadota bacterium]
LARTEKCHSLTAQVSVMVLLALTLERSGQTTAAEQQILTALHKSEQAGLIRTFADEGGELYALIARAHGKNTDPALALSDAYLRRLKAGFGVELGNQQLSRLTHPESGDKLTEAFSQREREILGLLARGMPNKRIAHSLNVSVDTVKWHLKNLYSKLGTSSRFDAVQCARRHGLIAD